MLTLDDHEEAWELIVKRKWARILGLMGQIDTAINYNFKCSKDRCKLIMELAAFMRREGDGAAGVKKLEAEVRAARKIAKRMLPAYKTMLAEIERAPANCTVPVTVYVTGECPSQHTVASDTIKEVESWLL